MNKQTLIKSILFFVVTFVVLLVVMTVLLGFLRKPQPSEEFPAQADSLQTVLDSTVQRPAESSGPNLDSLQNVLARIERENHQLKQKLETETKKEKLVEGKESLQENAKRVAKIYESMPPDEAAGILSEVNSDLAVAIISAMKERQAAKVLAVMNPKLAVLISEKLAKFN